VAKTADHLPLYRQAKIFERHGVDISRKTMGGWLAQCAHLLDPLYGSLKDILFESKVIGTDDTGVKVLDQLSDRKRRRCRWLHPDGTARVFGNDLRDTTTMYAASSISTPV
jgi:transposase